MEALFHRVVCFPFIVDLITRYHCRCSNAVGDVACACTIHEIDMLVIHGFPNSCCSIWSNSKRCVYVSILVCTYMQMRITSVQVFPVQYVAADRIQVQSFLVHVHS